MFDQSHEIAATQPVFRQVVRQRNISIKFEGHKLSASMGIIVMNFVTPDKCSVIQIVLPPALAQLFSVT